MFVLHYSNVSGVKCNDVFTGIGEIQEGAPRARLLKCQDILDVTSEKMQGLFYFFFSLVVVASN